MTRFTKWLKSFGLSLAQAVGGALFGDGTRMAPLSPNVHPSWRFLRCAKAPARRVRCRYRWSYSTRHRLMPESTLCVWMGAKRPWQKGGCLKRGAREWAGAIKRKNHLTITRHFLHNLWVTQCALQLKRYVHQAVLLCLVVYFIPWYCLLFLTHLKLIDNSSSQ